MYSEILHFPPALPVSFLCPPSIGSPVPLQAVFCCLAFFVAFLSCCEQSFYPNQTLSTGGRNLTTAIIFVGDDLLREFRFNTVSLIHPTHRMCIFVSILCCIYYRTKFDKKHFYRNNEPCPPHQLETDLDTVHKL